MSKIPYKKPWYEISMQDIPFCEYTNIFVGNLVWIQRGIENDIATYDLVVREMPDNWNYYVFYGLDRFVDMLLKYRFNKEGIKVLKAMGVVSSPKIERFYKDFKFTGDIMAMEDGTIFFPGEPIVRVSAPIVQANMLTAFIMNAFSYPIRLMTKAMRIKEACADTLFFGGSLVRLNSYDQVIWNQKISQTIGSPQGSPSYFLKFPERKPTGKITANINHALIKSFLTERDAYRYVLDNLLSSADFFFVMVDTYDMKVGLDTFIEEIKRTQGIDQKKIMITIDSGDIQEQAFYVREKLNENGLRGIRIQAMSSLDEYSIAKMVKEKTPIDCYISATAFINIIDCPKLEAVYKVAELIDNKGVIEYKAKLTKGKESYPGRKQVFRVIKNGKMAEDIIGLEDEALGEPLLKKIISNGKLTYSFPTQEEVHAYLFAQRELLPSGLRGQHKAIPYTVVPSKRLLELVGQVKKKHLHS